MDGVNEECALFFLHSFLLNSSACWKLFSASMRAFCVKFCSFFLSHCRVSLKTLTVLPLLENSSTKHFLLMITSGRRASSCLTSIYVGISSCLIFLKGYFTPNYKSSYFLLNSMKHVPKNAPFHSAQTWHVVKYPRVTVKSCHCWAVARQRRLQDAKWQPKERVTAPKQFQNKCNQAQGDINPCQSTNKVVLIIYELNINVPVIAVK